MKTTTQQKDLGTQLQDAVLRAAMPSGDDEIATMTLENPPKSDVIKRGGAFVKGGVAGPGRPKGSVPRAVKTVRDAVLEAFDRVGGPAYLAKLANGSSSDRAAFVSLVAKVLPTQVNANVEGGIQVQLSWLSGRSIGTTLSQTAEEVTQVIDLHKDSKGGYRIIDPVASVEAGGGAVDGQASEALGGAKDA
jgi:hypothetical protein